jgi:hypothetical protein
MEGDQMMDDLPETAKRPSRKGGRPTRAEATTKALRGVDLTAVDPLDIVRAIAADTSAPAVARLRAAEVLLERQEHAGETEATRQARAEARVRQRIGKRALQERDAATAASGTDWERLLDLPESRGR